MVRFGIFCDGEGNVSISQTALKEKSDICRPRQLLGGVVFGALVDRVDPACRHV